MTYSRGYPIRLIGGRLALDFVNTADWTEDGQIVHEKIADLADLERWLEALDLKEVRPVADLKDLLLFRSDLRDLLLGRGDPSILNAVQQIEIGPDRQSTTAFRDQPLKPILAISASSILSDGRERARVKLCPGENCGWLFLDETKNSRRRWCSMESCGNRAKAARHYARRTETRAKST